MALKVEEEMDLKRLRVWLQAEEEKIRCSITKEIRKVTRVKNVHISLNIFQ